MWALLTLIPKLLDKLPSIGKVAEIFVGNRAERDQAAHEENTQVAENFSKELSYAAPTRFVFDAIVDGISRMMRPVIVFGLVFLFALCPLWPDAFAKAMVAYQLVPEMMWWLLFLVIGFLFPSRVIEKMAMPAFKVTAAAKMLAERVSAEEERAASGEPDELPGVDDADVHALVSAPAGERVYARPRSDDWRNPAIVKWVAEGKSVY